MRLPVPNAKAISVLIQSLIQVTFCTEFSWFRAHSVIHCELSSHSEENWTISLNFTLIQRRSEITSQLFLKCFWISTKNEVLLNCSESILIRINTYVRVETASIDFSTFCPDDKSENQFKEQQIYKFVCFCCYSKNEVRFWRISEEEKLFHI